MRDTYSSMKNVYVRLQLLFQTYYIDFRYFNLVVHFSVLLKLTTPPSPVSDWQLLYTANFLYSTGEQSPFKSRKRIAVCYHSTISSFYKCIHIFVLYSYMAIRQYSAKNTEREEKNVVIL